jgi:hypothetical protein
MRRGFNARSTVLCHYVRMADEYNLALRQADQVPGDLYGIAEEIETVKVQMAQLASRAYVSRTVFMATASIWALLGAAMLLLMR